MATAAGALAALALIAAAAGALAVRARLDGWVREGLERSLAERLGAEVRIGELRLHLRELTADVEDLRIVPAAGDPLPVSLAVDSARLRLAWRGLASLPAGRIHLVELQVFEPEIVVERREATPAGTGDAGDARSRAPLDLRIDRLALVGGRVRVDDRVSELEVVAERLRLLGVWEPAGRTLAGAAEAVVRVQRFPLARPLELAASTDFRLGRHDLRLRRIEATGPGVELSGECTLIWVERPEAAGRGELAVELERLAPLLVAGAPELGGRVTGGFAFEVGGGGPPELRGRFTASQPTLARLSFAGGTGAVRVGPGGLTVEDLSAAAFDGRVSGRVEVAWSEATAGEPAVRLDLLGRGLAGDRLLAWLGLELPLAGAVDATLDLTGPAGDLGRGGVGQAAFDVRGMRPVRPGRVAVDGSGTVRFDRGQVTVEAPGTRIAAAGLDVEVTADLGAEPATARVRLDGRTADARATHAGTLLVLEALGVDTPEFVRQPIGGSGDVAAEIRVGPEPWVTLDLELAGGSWAGEPFDTAELAVTVAGEAVRVDRLRLRHGAEKVSATGRLSVPFAVELAEIEARDLAMARLAPFAGAGWPLPGGSLDADVRLARTPEGPAGAGRLRLEGGRWLGEPYDVLEARLTVAPGTIDVEWLELHAPAADVEGSALWHPERESGRLEVARAVLRPGALERLAGAGVDLGGELRVAGELEVDRGAWRGRFTAAGEDWTAGGWGPLDAAGELTVDPAGLEARFAGAGETWTAGLQVAWAEALPFELRLDVDGATLDLDPGGPVAGRVRLGGEFIVAGPLATPAEVGMEGTLRALELDLGTRAVALDGHAPVGLREGVLQLGPGRLAGPASDLVVELSWGVESGALDGSVRGAGDLGLLAAPFPRLRAAGRAEVELTVGGTAAAPEFAGAVRAADGRLRWLGFPQTLERISFEVRLDGHEAVLERFTGRFGNGEIRAGGRAEIGAGGVGRYRLGVEAANVRVAWPEGFRGIYEADLELAGGGEPSRLSGEVELLRGVYDRPFWPGGLFGGGGAREYAASDASWLPDDLLLDVAFRAGGGAWVRNETAKVESAFDLQVRGTPAQPEVTGRLWVLEGGEIVFRDVRYEIESGTVDFVELERIDPYFTLRARTEVAEYTVFLRVEGTQDRFDYELTSEPALPTPDIVALLTTGSTLEGIDGGDDSQFTGDLAANYFAGALTEPFERQLRRALSLERVSINPLLVQGSADPTARVTLGKRIAEDLFATYSTDVGSSERQLIRLDWQTTRKFRVGAERDTQGGLGGDLLYTDRFWWRGGPRRRQPAEPAVPAEPEPGRMPEGPAERPPVGRVELTGLPEAEAAALARRIPLRPGDPFSRSRMFAGVEALRRHYVAQGRLEASVDATADAGPERVDVTYRVAPGPVVGVAFEGVSRKDARRLRELLESLWVESVFHEDLWEDSAERVREYFRARGYYAVDVRHVAGGPEDAPLVRFVVDRGQPVRVASVTVEGAERVGEQRIRRQMLTRPGAVFSRQVLDPGVLDDDIAAIRNLYRDLGYLAAQVAPPRVRLAATADAADVELLIREGPQYLIESVDLSPGQSFDEATLRGWFALAPGDVYSPSAVLEATSALRHKLDEQGYPDARVRATREIGDGTVALELDVRPGRPARVAEVHISGNELTRTRIVERELALGPGDAISRGKLVASQHNLYRLGIFRDVRLDYRRLEEAGEPGAAVLEVRVEEAPPLTASVGAGWDSEAGPRGRFSLTHDNVGGHDRVLGFQGYASSIERRLQLTAKDPRLLTRRLPALANLSWEERDEVGFDQSTRAVALRVDRRLDRRWSAFLRYGFQRVDLEHVEDSIAVLEEKLEDISLGDVGFTAYRDTRDDPFAPRRGSLLTLSTRLFAEPFGSEVDFLQHTVGYSRVWPLGRRVSVFGAVRAGLASTLGTTDRVPISERFFAGGSSSVRGFDRDTVGPLSTDRVPLGGEARFLFNQELRFPLRGPLGGVVFHDAGNVWERPRDLDPLDVRHVLGAGLRYETPIGAIRLEYGHKLDREPGESPGELFLAIGPLF